jgi:hypothetical protein
MGAADALQVIAATMTVAIVVLAVAGAVAVWSRVRAARRRYQRLRGVFTGMGRIGDGGRYAVRFAAARATDVSWWVVQRERHRLWRSVTAADRAVSSAVDADAPVGDLPALVRRLRRGAGTVDAALRACGSTADVAAQRAQVTEMVDAADQVRRAALDSLTAVAQPAVSGLADAVRIELAAVRHGLAAMPTIRR